MVKNGLKWSKMLPNGFKGPIWAKMVQSIQKGPKLSEVFKIIWHGQKRSKVVQNLHMDWRGIFWDTLYIIVYTMLYSLIYMIQLHLNFVLFPNLISATWHSKMVWHVILWILSEWHWQHYQHCTVQHWQHYQQCWALTTLSTEFPPSMLCNSRNCSPGYVLHPTDDRASQKSHQYPLQNTDNKSNLRTWFHYCRKSPQ